MTRTALVAVLALLALAPCAARADVEVSLGVVNQIDDEDSVGVATLAWVTDHEHPYELLVGQIQAREDDIAPTETFVAASKRLTWRRWYFGSGIALADTDSDNRTLSGTLQFLTAIGWSAERWSVSLRHLSNAGIEGRNHGETFLVVGFRF